ncbi:MAG: PAS domain S-box protein [Syntrophales bacterium]
MKDEQKTKEQLIQELVELRRRLSKFERSELELLFRGDPPHESERLYASLAEQSNDAVCLVCRGKFEYINSKFTDLFGITRDQFFEPDFDFMSLFAPESRPLLEERLQKSMKGEPLDPRFTFTALTTDGRRIDIEASFSYVPYKGAIATQGTLRNVTGRGQEGKLPKAGLHRLDAPAEPARDVDFCKKADADLDCHEAIVQDIAGQSRRKTEELQALESSVLAAIPHAVFGLKNRRIIFANDSVESIFGWKPQELIGRDMRTLYRSDEEYEEIGRRVYPELEKKRVWSMELEFPCRHKNGNDIICSISASRIGSTLDDQKIVAIYEDITKRKQAEEALKESERRLKDIINFLPDPTFVINREGKVIAWNRAMEAITRIKAEEILGKGDYEYAVPLYGRRQPILIDLVLEKDEEIEKKYANIKRHDQVLIGESYIPDLNGREAYLLGTAAALYDSRGNIVGAVESIRDVTESRHAERARKELEAEFLQAQKMEAIGTLAGGIAHDFNNLLMAIQGYTSLMLLGMDSDNPNYKKLKSIEEQVMSGADLTRQLLGFARGGRYEVKPIEINNVVETTSTMFGRTKKEISIQKKLAPDLWKVDADQGQIEQVLLNLYVNAWQAMPGGGELYISTENVTIDEKFTMPFHTKPGHYVKISITDTGIGMDEKTRQRIFEPFFTTKEMGRGTGLGLASVYGIIKGHGGIINVYSEKGHGTTFKIYLPASENKIEEAQKTSENLVKGHETILLVDDEEMIVDVSREILETLGYKVLVARSGKEAIDCYKNRRDEIDLVILDMIIPEMGGGRIFEVRSAEGAAEALEILKKENIDVIFLDLKLFGTDGIELCRQIRKFKPASLIYAMTGWSALYEIDECREAGFDDYFTKPIKTEVLFKAVEDGFEKLERWAKKR